MRRGKFIMLLGGAAAGRGAGWARYGPGVGADFEFEVKKLVAQVRRVFLRHQLLGGNPVDDKDAGLGRGMAERLDCLVG